MQTNILGSRKTQLRHLSASGFLAALMIAICAFPTSAAANAINPSESESSQQRKTIKGLVVDTNGEPLIGVGIIEVGTNNGTLTDADGSFTLTVSAENALLTASLLGFNDKTVQANDNVRIILEQNTTALDEVVVIGYGTQKKVNLTGSVSSVNLEKEALSRPITTTAQALAGMSAGVQVLQSSGRPNSEGVGINIRGIGTLNTSSPLVLVDGMEMSLNDVNPNDVENISILKDAASCAIYGNRGANGVILVTTKSGKEGQVHVTYSGKFSINTPSKLVKFVSNYADYMGFVNEAASNVGISQIYSQNTIDTWRAAEKDPNGIAASGYPNYVAYPNTDWYDEIYQTKIMQEHSLSVLGKEGRTDYSIGVTYLDNPGMIVNSGVKKYFLNIKLNTDITPWLQIGAHAWGDHTDQDRNDVGNLSEWSFLKATPGIYPYYDGKYGGIEAPEEDPAASNPLLNLNGTGDSYYKYNRVYTTTHAQIRFLKDFTWRTQFGYNLYQTRHKYNWIGQDQWSFSRNQKVGNRGSLSDDNVYMYHQQYYNWKLTHTLNWSRTFNDIHDITALAGFEEGKYYNHNTDVRKQGIVDPSITDLSTVTEMRYINGADNQNTFRSWFGRVTYAYDSKYLLEANFRYDGSSKFSKNNRWGFFPSVSGAWRISQENFMQNIGWLNNLKLRASWGKLGNNSVGDYAYQSMYTLGYTAMNNQKTGIAWMGTLPNEDISWEETTTTDIGLDFGLFGGQLEGVIDLYNKDTDGILYRPDIYMTLGEKTAPLQNLAEVVNRGLEITLGWHDTIGQVTYGIQGNVTFNHNEVTDYKGTLKRGWTTDSDGNKVYRTNLGDVSTGGLNRIVEGHQINEFYIYKTYKGDGSHFNSDGTVNINGGPKDGMIRTEDDMKWLQAMISAGYQFLPNRTVSKSGIWYGDYIFSDLNEDGVYGDSNDRDFTGMSTTPKVNFGIQTFLNWKGIDFSMNWTGATGFQTYWREIGQNACAVVFGLQLPKKQAYDHYFYDPSNPTDSRTSLSSKNPRLTMNNPSQSDNLQSNLYLYKCNFLKLRNLTIGYTLPKSISQKFYTDNLRVYFSGENLLTITNFPGLDPEMRSGEGYTTMRQWSFGINLTF